MNLLFAFCSVALLLIQIVSLSATSSGMYSMPVKDPVAVSKDDPEYAKKPFIDGARIFYDGKIVDWDGKTEDVTSPIIDKETGKRTVIGRLAQLSKGDVKVVLDSAKLAWANGRGTWPQMSTEERIAALERVVQALKAKRSEIANVLMWEICKSTADAYAEFDRTMTFIEETIKAYRDMDQEDGSWRSIGGILSRVRRAAIGIMLCLGPFNYPFNETYATLIPALLSGNVVIMKIPNTGGLAHLLTMQAYADNLPPGTINFFSGSGRETLAPIMETGDIDVLAFIGGSKAADSLIKAHPHPHRLKVFLQLEGKNLGVVLPDADIATAVEQITIGSTNFNGQRCTAIKLVFVHVSIVAEFVEKFIVSISKLKWGLPWEKDVAITPLPELRKPKYLEDVIKDALSKGANLVNALQGGGNLHGGLVRPAIVFPVKDNMKLWHEEQFGPVIPIAVYSDIEEVHKYLDATPFGQQAAVFTKSPEDSAALIDALSTVVGRINLNTQCGRSPDVIPFSGRRSSAMGTMSVTEAIRYFSIETVVAGKHNKVNEKVMKDYENYSKFLLPLANSSYAAMKNTNVGSAKNDL